ncbi:hypothetical protein os4_07250 [Comamonadaceae bacterium OS-4]|jgi:hypothetical protein|nr:hypothetical protein os4_07250 [Comamonadaceae bacterium OS-4]
MSARNPLRRHIETAWQRTIAEAYSQQLINSERGLQVHFCHRLLEEFESHQRRVFVEPCFRAQDGSVRSPDIVVCNSQRIIGVIELKYLPRMTAKYAKDLGTLNWFASARHPVEVSNDRYRGVNEIVVKRYELASDAVLCWAGVYAGPRVDIESQALGLGSRFLCLHATTKSGRAPDIYPHSD